MLERAEYVEQAYFFRVLGERLQENQPTQEILGAIREEILGTTKLPMAIDYLLSELKHGGAFAPAMSRLGHYFTAFQSYVIWEAEDDRSRFDMRIALEILRSDAQYRADGATPQGVFLYRFESLCRNRLGYDRGLEAISQDPIFDDGWGDWILTVRRQIGIVDVADLIYVRSQHYLAVQARKGVASQGPQPPVLFGEKEGRIALANRRKDPLWLFAALQRQLGYPAIPRLKPVNRTNDLLPVLAQRIERLERRLRLIEEEQRGGIDLDRFYRTPEKDPPE